MGKMFRVDRAAVKIAVERNAFAGGEFVRDVNFHLVKHPTLCGQITLPVGFIQLGGRQLVRHKSMPRLQRRAALSIVNPHRKQREQDGDAHYRQSFGPFNDRPGRHAHS
ncbi:hypothetical protein D3C80_1210000 [compost metagenome]